MKIAQDLWEKVMSFTAQAQPAFAGAHRMAASGCNYCRGGCEGNCMSTCIRSGADVPAGNPGGADSW